MRNTALFFVGPAAVFLAITGICGHAVAGQTQHKSAKQCNDEARINAVALSEAGESLHDFVKECWWSTSYGELTPIRRQVAKASPNDPAEYTKPAGTAAAIQRSSPTTSLANAEPAATARPVEQHTASLPVRHTRYAAGTGRRFAQTSSWSAPSKGQKRQIGTITARSTAGRRTRYVMEAGRDVLNRKRLVAASHTAGGKRLFASRPSRAHYDYALNKEAVAPPVAINGRRVWTRDLTGYAPAVLIGNMTHVRHNVGLTCWGQPVLFWNARAGARWSSSAVCVSNTEEAPLAAETKKVFIAYR